MKIMVINGPNLNMLGIREKSIYGNQNYDYLKKMITEHCDEKGIDVELFQSNHEGNLVDWIQKAFFEEYDGIVINPAAYTHTSVAIRDAVKAIKPVPVVEVHISDISEREEFRKLSYLEGVASKSIIGRGFQGYLDAIDYLYNL